MSEVFIRMAAMQSNVREMRNALMSEIRTQSRASFRDVVRRHGPLLTAVAVSLRQAQKAQDDAERNSFRYTMSRASMHPIENYRRLNWSNLPELSIDGFRSIVEADVLEDVMADLDTHDKYVKHLWSYVK